MSDYIPKDIWIQIFIRANIKSVLQCTSVCKSWHSIITSPNFAEAHLNRQKTTRELLFIGTYTNSSQKEVFSWHSDDVAFTEVGHSSPLKHPHSDYYRIVGSSNGVICLVDDSPMYHGDTFLWNPAIRVWVKLPPPRITRESCLDFDCPMAFSVDPVSNDCKVIRIHFQNKGSHEITPKVLMYTLSSGKWENVSSLPAGFKYLLFNTATQVYFNGASHWAVLDKENHCLAISLFHFGEKVFRSVKLPADVASPAMNWSLQCLKPAVSGVVFSG